MIAFIDTETTGLDPKVHEIVSVGIVLVDTRLQILEKREWLVRPERLEDADPVALALNGYDHALWCSPLHAVDKLEAMHAVRHKLSGLMVAGHNVEFDRRFILAECERVGLEPPRWHYAALDTGSMAWPMLYRGEVPNLKLDTLTAHFGIEYGEPHRALNDAMRSLMLARKLCAMFGNESSR